LIPRRPSRRQRAILKMKLDGHAWRRDLRAAVPLLITATRLILGGAALALSLEGEALFFAATLITLSIVGGGLNGPVARWLDASSSFGRFFDGLTDYLTLIVTPWVLTRTLLIGRRSLLQEVLLDLPLMTGTIRCARQGQLVVGEPREGHQLPGLDPVFFAFVAVTTVFLRLPELLSSTRLTALLIPAVAVSSVLMIVPVRYPRLTAVPGLAVLPLVAAMPFVGTQILAALAIVLGLVYVLVAPLFAGPSSAAPKRPDFGDDQRGSP